VCLFTACERCIRTRNAFGAGRRTQNEKSCLSSRLAAISLATEAAGQRIVGGSSRRVEPAALRFIPYYAWNHRGAGPMAVWMPREAREAGLPYDTAK
jgi:hypothetical protein